MALWSCVHASAKGRVAGVPLHAEATEERERRADHPPLFARLAPSCGPGIRRLRGGSSRYRGLQTDEFGKEDQLLLNKYAGLNFRRKDLLEALKEKEDEAEGLRNAADEILMSGQDGPENFQAQRRMPMGVDFRWGETFSEWSVDRAQEELDHRVEVNQIAQDHLNQDIEDVAGEMSKIKAILKGKFGEQVVLDDESDDASESPHENSSDPQPETG